MLRIIFLLSALLITININAQQFGGQTCDQAKGLIIGNNVIGLPTNYTPSTSGGTACTRTDSRDAWFSVIAPADFLEMILSYRGNNVTAYRGDCSQLVELDRIGYTANCGDSEEVVTFSTIPGETLLFRYSTDRVETIQDNFTLTGKSVAANQICQQAMSLDIGIPYDLTTSVYEVESPQNNYCLTNDRDIWFSFVAPASGQVFTEHGVQAYGKSGVLYAGDCNGMTAIDCLQDGKTSIGLIPGDTYFIQLQETSFRSIELRESVISPPANMDCSSAINLALDQQTTLNPLHLNQNEYTYCNGSIVAAEYWYSFTFPSQGAIEISLYTGIEFEVYSGSCGNLVLEYCNNNDNVIEGLNANQNYFIRILNPFSNGRTTTIRHLNFGAGYTCSDPLAVSISTSSCENEIIFSSSNAAENTGVCYNDETRWFSFVAPATGDIYIDFLNNTLKALVYEDNCSSLNLIAEAYYINGLVAGQTYILAAVGYNNFNGTLCISERNSAGTNTTCAIAESISTNSTIDFNYGLAELEIDANNDPCENDLNSLWYSFTATAEFMSVEQSTEFENLLYSGTCGSLSPVEMRTIGNEEIYENLIIGEVYFLKMGRRNGFSPNDDIDVLLTDFPSNVAEDCIQAIDLTINSYQYSDLEMEFTQSLSSTPLPAGVVDNGNLVDSWGKFTAGVNGISIQTALNQNNSSDYFIFYSGDCTTPTELIVFDPSFKNGFQYGDLIPGVDYWLRKIYDKDATTSFEIRSMAISGGTCETAQPAIVYSSEQTKLQFANLENYTTTALDFLESSDVSSWWEFTVPASGAIIIQELEDFKIYENDCVNLTEVFDGAGYSAERKPISLTPGNAYYLRIKGRMPLISNSNRFLLLEATPAPQASNCAEAINLSVSTDGTCGNTISGSSSTSVVSFGDFCGRSTAKSIFYAVSPVTSGTHTISLDNAAALHRLTVFSDCNLTNPVACGVSTIDAQLNAGTAYYIAVFPDQEGVTSNFDICIYQTTIPAGANNVGISTENPQAKLDVNGGIKPGFTSNALPGNMRWNNDLEVFDGSIWKSTTEWDHLAAQDIDMQNLRVTNAADPVSPSDLATKAYVDGFPDNDNSTSNELQTISKSGSTVSLSDGGGTFTDEVDDADNDPTNEVETWATLSGIPADIQDGDDVDDADNDPTNEIETWATLTGIPADLQDGDDVDDADNDPTNEVETWATLAGIPADLQDGDDVDDADNDPTNEVETWATLAGIPADLQDGDDVNDADNDPTNEIETWSTLAGIPADLQDGDDVDDADNNPSNELQTISKLGNTVTLSNGGGTFTDEVNDADADSNNEKITSINLSGSTLSINEPANTQTVDLSDIATQWKNDGVDVYSFSKVGIGVSDPQEELDMSGTFQVTKNSSSGNPHINLVETGADFVRFYMENNTGNRAVIAANPKTDSKESIINFFHDGAGDVMTIKGNEMVGINDITPLHTMEVNAANTADNPLIVRTGGTEHLEILDNGHILIGNNVTDEASKLIKVANGAYLSTGGTWTNASSRDLKKNFQSVDAQDILLKLSALNILRWRYKSDSTATHLGPIAEEFYESFQLGGNDKSISTVDASGVALVAIQALYEESEQVKKENQTLKKENETMKNLLQNLLQRVENMEAEMKN